MLGGRYILLKLFHYLSSLPTCGYLPLWGNINVSPRDNGYSIYLWSILWSIPYWHTSIISLFKKSKLPRHFLSYVALKRFKKQIVNEHWKSIWGQLPKQCFLDNVLWCENFWYKHVVDLIRGKNFKKLALGLKITGSKSNKGSPFVRFKIS